MQVPLANILFGTSLLVLSFVPFKQAAGNTTSILITGDSAPGVASAEFDSFTAGPLANDGKFVFSSHLAIGPGGVTTGDDEGVWWFDGTSTTLLAREGTAGVPEVLGANFNSFSDLAIGSAGDVIVRAALENGPGGVTSDSDQGIWRYPGGVGSLLARTGSGDTPDVLGANFLIIPIPLKTSTDPRVAFNGTLVVEAGVSSDNDKGIWSYTGDVGTLIAREGTGRCAGSR